LIFRVTKSGNEDLSLALTDWVFKQRGVLRAKNIRHYLKKDKTTPSFYTIKNDIVNRENRKEINVVVVFF
jgi:oligosaccharyltransferase complex subunit beta